MRCAGDGFSAFGLSSLLAGSTRNHVRWLAKHLETVVWE